MINVNVFSNIFSKSDHLTIGNWSLELSNVGNDHQVEDSGLIRGVKSTK